MCPVRDVTYVSGRSSNTWAIDTHTHIAHGYAMGTQIGKLRAWRVRDNASGIAEGRYGIEVRNDFFA